MRGAPLPFGRLGSALLLAAALTGAALAARPASAQEPPPAEPARGEEVEEPPPPGFGQAEGEEPRLPRLRLEVAFNLFHQEARARHGHGDGVSNNADIEKELGVGHLALGLRATATLKLHRFFALGVEYHTFGARGRTTTANRRIAFGFAFLQPSQRVRAVIEAQQADFDVRIVAADDGRFRAEFFFGAAWISFRLGVHPRGPLLPASWPAIGARARGASKREQDLLGPALGLFFCWNFHSRVAVFVENRSAYICPTRFGSYASWVRGGFRFHLGEGLELVVAGAWDSGQVLAIRDVTRVFGGRALAHKFQQASWYALGADVGVSFTY